MTGRRVAAAEEERAADVPGKHLSNNTQSSAAIS
jgi:hypothetical protein